MIIEDLGDELVVESDQSAPIEARYEAATDLLAELHSEPASPVIPVEPGTDYRLPLYDIDAYLIEAELLLDWYLPKLEIRISEAKRENYRALWREALLPVLNEPQTWVLRDFHSPNLLWLPERDGTARVGLLDFQDAVMGPAAFDVASLLQDARVDVPEKMEIALLSRYTRARRSIECDIRCAGIRPFLCDTRRATGVENPGDFCPSRTSGPQAAIPASSPARIDLSATLSCAPGTCFARGLVSRQRATGEGLIMPSATTRVAPRRAMVLAAGLGTRMRPLTDSTPKPLVKVAGKPLIDHVLDRLADAGVEQAVVNVHHFAEQLQRHLAHRQRPKIVISDERGLLLGTGGGVKRALPELGDAPFFHVNSDTIWIDGVKSNLSRLANSFDAAATDALLLLAPTTGSVGYSGRGDFSMTSDGSLLKRTEQEVAPFVYAGAAILSPALFKDAPSGEFSLTTLFERAAHAKRLHGLRLDGVWMHVGTPEAIGEAEAAIRASTG